jgi:O-antigen/teichoic acid export membrane protein
LLRAVGVLVTGTALGHVITALALPVATRLYSPADFSMLAVFSGLVSIIGVAACLRFDVAVPMPKEDADAMGVLALAMTFALASTAVVAAVMWIWSDEISNVLRQPELEPHLWMVPVGVLVVAWCSALQGWFVRARAFSGLAGARIAQSAAGAATQIGLGAAGVGVLGLLAANVVYSGGGLIWFVWRLWRSNVEMLRFVNWSQMRGLAREYSRFPRYSTLESLANSASIQVPIILIAALAAGPDAGHLLLAMQVMQVPMAVIGNAVGQVYLSQASAEYRLGRLGPFTAGIMSSLLRAGVGPLVFAAIVAPVVFPILFGAQWQRAGWLVTWMMPWFVMQFLASPVSMALHVTGHQRRALWLQLGGFLLRVSIVLAAARAANGRVAEAYAVSGFLFYLAYVWIVVRTTGVRISDLTSGAWRSLGITAAWVVAGLALAPLLPVVAVWTLRHP